MTSLGELNVKEYLYMENLIMVALINAASCDIWKPHSLNNASEVAHQFRYCLNISFWGHCWGLNVSLTYIAICPNLLGLILIIQGRSVRFHKARDNYSNLAFLLQFLCHPFLLTHPTPWITYECWCHNVQRNAYVEILFTDC